MSGVQRRTTRARGSRAGALTWALWAACALGAASSGCRRGAYRARGHGSAGAASRATAGSVSGLYWGRVGDVPDGMRAQVWLEGLSDGRVRGGYEAVPWSGDVEGRVQGDGSLAVTMRERGFSSAMGARDRELTLRWERPGSVLGGYDARRFRVELVRANRGEPGLRPGLWVARWTGLPHGVGVEMRVSHDEDGHYRATYQYQGTGGVRDGSFDGTVTEQGALVLRWTELVEGGAIARGRARLQPWAFGMRGTYGIDETEAGTGEWTMEFVAE